MAGCCFTASNRPALVASSARMAAASTGVDTGRLPAPASVAAPSSSASRYVVTKVTAASPMPEPAIEPRVPAASSRRDATPTWFDGTTTVTGASGSPALAAATASWSARAASRPYPVHTMRKAMSQEGRHGL